MIYNIKKNLVYLIHIYSQFSLTVNLEPLYFEPYLPVPVEGIMTSNDCYSQCMETFNCVQFVFYNSTSSCYLISKFNPANGLEDHNAIVKSIKSLSTGYLLKNLEVGSIYKIRVDYLTPYGIKGSSNIVTYNMGSSFFKFLLSNLPKVKCL